MEVAPRLIPFFRFVPEVHCLLTRKPPLRRLLYLPSYVFSNLLTAHRLSSNPLSVLIASSWLRESGLGRAGWARTDPSRASRAEPIRAEVNDTRMQFMLLDRVRSEVTTKGFVHR